MKKQLCTLFAAILLSLSMQAQTVMNLQECIEMALQNSLEIDQVKLGLGRSQIELTRAKHLRYPSLSASSQAGVNFGRFVNPITDAFITQNFFSNSIGVNTGVSIFNGFSISNSIKQAMANRDASNYDIAQAERDVALAVANNYLSVLFADENLAIAQSQLQESKSQQNLIAKLISAGSRPANAIFEIDAKIATDEQSVITAENNKIIALLQLKQQMRMEPSEPLEIVTPTKISTTLDADVLEYDELYENAIASQPNLIAAEYKLKSAELGVKVAKGALLPSLNAGGGVSTNYGVVLNDLPGVSQKSYGTQLDENLSANVGVSLSIPIYNNYRDKRLVEIAKLEVLQVKNDNESILNNLKVVIQQAITDAKGAKRKLNAAQKSVAAQQANLDNAQKRFEVGAINSFEYVTIQNNASQAEVTAAIAKYEYLFAMKVIDFYLGKQITLD